MRILSHRSGSSKSITYITVGPWTLYLVDYKKQTRGQKQKSIEEKQFALVAKVFCGHAYSTDFDWTHSENE